MFDVLFGWLTFLVGVGIGGLATYLWMCSYLRGCLPLPSGRIRLVPTRIEIRDKPTEKVDKMELVLRTDQYAKLTLSPVDAEGQPADLDPENPIKAVTTSGDMRLIVSPIEADKGLVVYVIPGGVGRSEGKLFGDSEPGEDVVLIEEDIILDAVAPNAVGLGVNLAMTGKKSDLPQEIKDILNAPPVEE